MSKQLIALTLTFVALTALVFPNGSDGAQLKLLNVSYDPTRELYQELDKAFAKYWLARGGTSISVKESHGGSGKQARAVIDGLEADVVTLGLAYDIDQIAQKGKLLPPNWQKRLPHNSSPYTSTIVFLVRQGNPKQIKDWPDLVKPGVQIIVPNPKTSGGGRWAYLAACGFALRHYGGNEEKTSKYMQSFYKNVPVLDSGARGSTTTFVERGIGDVLVAWENEAMLAIKETGKDKLILIRPSLSILAEPPVSIVDTVVDRKGTRQLAQAYLEYLYTPEAQEIVANNFYRPTDANVLSRHGKQFPRLSLFTVDDTFGGWQKAHKFHFADGGKFDQIYKASK